MKHQPNLLSVAISAALGIAATYSSPVVSAVDPGVYDLVVIVSPTTTTSLGGTLLKPGKDGAWNSSFTFGGGVPTATSEAMTDNGLKLVRSDGTLFGSSISGDGFAGILGITVNGGGGVTVLSFSKDVVPGTAGGSFAQETDAAELSNLTGTVNLTTGAMTLTTVDFATGDGRQGGIDTGSPGAPCGGATFTPEFCDQIWNKDDFGPVQSASTFTTGSAAGDITTINGAVLTSIGDVDGDGTLNDQKAVLVSGGDVGQAWASFAGNDYYEVWSVQLRYKGGFAGADATSTALNTARIIPVLTNDFGRAPLSVTAVTAPANGTAVINADNTITYTPNPGFSGPDSFMYTLTDGFGKIANATVSVTVSAGAIAANDDTVSISQGSTSVINVAANDVGALDPTTVVPTSPSAQGATVTDNDNGNVTYTPPVDFVGTDIFSYTIMDTGGNSDSAIVTVTVSAGPLTNQGTYANGSLAASVGATNGRVSAAQIGVVDNGVGSSCQGDCFDFVVSGASNPAVVVLPPPSAAIAHFESSQNNTISRYRKLRDGVLWGDFDTSAGDSVASAPLSVRGGCPAPDSAAWKTWNGAVATSANNNDRCIRLTIADNGQNDSNNTVGVVGDPGGVGSTSTSKPPTGTVSSFTKNAGGGCSLRADNPPPAGRADWWILGVFIGMLGWMRRRQVQG